MTSDDMASRFNMYRELPSQFENALQSFRDSQARFRLLKTIRPSTPPLNEPCRPALNESPRTLFILDSSFNPPSIAHYTLAQSVLEKTYADRYPGPYRLLLLFSTMNADKAPSAASFQQRLVMMTIFARDILDNLAEDSEQKHHLVPIDVGVTTAPYYTDKSKAIEAEGSQWYPDQPRHIHLVGFDTLTRFFGAKYYPKFDPPFSALNPYFDGGHRLRVTMRPDNDYGTTDDQQAFLERLRNGEMENDGAKREWAWQVEMVPPNPKAGVSSTKIRNAAKTQDWSKVEELCTEGVAGWLRTRRLYESDGEGKKMG